MPKTSSTRTFAGCWTCRRRNVRCDTLTPKCSPCKRSQLVCEGYHIRLAWVDPVSGEYTPCRRRSYPSHLTWANQPKWTSRQIDHLISQCDQGYCNCRLHQRRTPFLSFQRHRRRQDADDNRPGHIKSPAIIELPAYEEGQSFGGQHSTALSNAFGDIDASILTDSESSTSTTPRLLCDVQGQDRSIDLSTVTPEAHMDDLAENDLVIHTYEHSKHMRSSILPMAQITGKEDEEIRLLHHYVLHVSPLMVPVDGANNPWKSTYLAIGSQQATSAARAVYSATLAQAALHLIHLKGPRRGAYEKAQAVKYIGMAIKELRNSLSSPTDDYTSVLAALLTLISVQHIFQSNSHGWREHYRGAVGFVSQYLRGRPWLLSWDAWIVTQSLVLGIIFAETANQSRTGISPVHELLVEVMTEPQFGCTVGGNARHLRAIYEIRSLEEEIAQNGSTTTLQDMSPAMFEQVSQIIQQMQSVPDGPFESDQPLDEVFEFDTSSPTQTLVKLHSQLFDGAVMIHLFRVVLQYPPSAVTTYVHQTLTSVVEFMDRGGGPVSAWPAFIAAAEACTDEDQALATH